MSIPTPRHLSGEAGNWFSAMIAAFDFADDPSGLKMLETAATQLQRAVQYREQIAADGLIVKDRFGFPKEHPGAVGERAAANLHRLLCRELGLEVDATVDEQNRLPRLHRGAS